MYLPQLPVPQTSRMMTEVFYGYNHNLRIQQGESFDQTNITLDQYPVLSQRKRRGIRATAFTTPNGLLAKKNLAWVDGKDLYFNEYKITGTPSELTSGKKQLVSMGAYLIVFPDGFYYNTEKSTDKGMIGAEFSTAGNNVTYTLCAAIGEEVDSEATIQNTPPANPEDGDYWIDTSVSPQNLKQYSSYSAQWVIVPTTYIKIESSNIDSNFEVGDGIALSGIAYTGDSDAMREAYDALNGDNIIAAKGSGYIVITGIVPSSYTQTYSQASDAITVSRKLPDMDFVIESNNRLWGCKYGVSGDKVVNEIYCSKLGDFKNWRCYAGISTDSYAVSVGTDGPFTGAITYNNYPMFFKEDCVHQIYGAYPATYQVVTSRIPGVKKGSGASLVNEGGYLFYASPMGICQYDGSTARYVSAALGETKYSDAVAGTFNNKVYFSLKKSTNDWDFLCYDIQKGFWTREDDTHALYFAATEYDLFFINSDGYLNSVHGTAGTLEDPVRWEIVSGQIGYEYPDQKYLSRFNLRMSLGAGSTARLYVQYDSSGQWLPQGGEMKGFAVRTFTLPVVPHRCDHMQIKLVGRGEMKLYSIAKIYEAGSDVT